jgi:hypothetical protein
MERRELSGHHLATVEKILAHPTSHNIAWHDVVSMLAEIGTVVEEPNQRFTVTVGGETETFDRPKGADIDEQQVVDLRRMLRNSGVALPGETGKPGDAVTASEGDG